MNLNRIPAYECLEQKELKDLDSMGYLLQHKKTKANIVVIKNKDENKVFSIGFRTPPKDSTGVAHIVEHTVLCGSREFPAKDPFVELVKGSLNTFLNAMTFPDKTVYPVASCNDKDFQNLCHVYMDAVFYPNIYQEKRIFEQEGWHYELNSEEGALTYNGVVFNEMKGVFSSPEQLLSRLIMRSLFPDNAYSVDSGGEPSEIPDLTYGDYLDFHKSYYHPSNSYIYLYGDMDMEEKLNWIDQDYLSDFAYLKPESEILRQKPFEQMVSVKEQYSLTEGESTDNKTYFSYNTVIEDTLNREFYQAFAVLEYVLLSTPGAPVKQALIDAGIGSEIQSSFDNGIMQPVFSIIAKNVEPKQKEQFLNVIFDTMKKVVKEGIEEKSLRAAINYFEFKNREADFGRYPKGLMYGFQILDSWLYDNTKPFLHMEANEIFRFLKSQIGTGYFEQLIEKYLIDNPHSSFVTVEPKVGLTSEMDQQERKRLEDYKNSLNEEQKKELIEHTKSLRRFQEEPSAKEDLEKIPLLEISDIDKEAKKLICEETKVADSIVLKHETFTNGIAYLRLAFDVTDRKEYAPYLSLLVTMFGYVNTKNYTYLQLSNEIDIYTGGIVNNLSVYEEMGSDKYRLMIDFQGKVLYENVAKAFELIKEMMENTLFDDEKRFREIIAETRSRYQIKLQSSGHSTAVGRCMSYDSESGFITDMIKGIGYYDFLTELESDFDNRKNETLLICEKLMKEIFRKENFIGSITAESEGFEACQKELRQFIPNVLDGEKTQLPVPHCETKSKAGNEGFKTAGKVQYVARTGNYIKKGLAYTGALKVVSNILNSEYLWKQVRVKGGAYGVMSGFSVTGNSYFVSYRDPNLEKTIEVYEGVESYLENFKIDDRDMTKYIIGAISNLDTPLTPKEKGAKAYSMYLSKVNDSDLQKEREEVLSTNVEKIRAVAPIPKAIMDCNRICVIGSEESIEQNRKLFDEVKSLT